MPYTRTVPVSALIELTNVCNLNCTMCNIHDQKRPTDFMKAETFERILDQLSEIGINSAGLYYLGETFVFPHLDKILNIAEKRNFKIHIRSNAHYAKRIDKLHKQFPNLMNSLSFSIDGATKETFEKIRRGGKIEKVYESLETIHKINDGKIDSRIDMSIYAVLSKDNIYELPDFFKNFSKYCYPENIKFFLLESVSTAPGYVSENSPWPNLSPKTIPCSRPFKFVYFLHNGDVSTCCWDFDDEFVIGNIFEDSLLNIWNGTVAQEFRDKHLNPEKMDIQTCIDCVSSNKNAELLINEYIQALYSKNRSMSGQNFGNKILDFILEMDSAVGQKNDKLLNKCIQDRFSSLN